MRSESSDLDESASLQRVKSTEILLVYCRETIFITCSSDIDCSRLQVYNFSYFFLLGGSFKACSINNLEPDVT